jgi:hypothetical protein
MPAQDTQQSKFGHLPLSTSGPLECALKGTVLLNHPYFNKGSAFTPDERRDFELSGLLPPSVQTLEQQVQRAYEQYSAQPDDLAKNTFLTSMKEQNEVLYFKVRTRQCRAVVTPDGGCGGRSTVLIYVIVLVAVGPSRGDVQCCVHAHRGGGHPELLADIPAARGCVLEHPRH